MPSDPSIVQPAPDASTPAAVEPAAGNAPASETSSEVSDEVLKIPAMQGLVSGAVPAFSVDFATFGKQPEAKAIAANRDGLLKMGIFFYHARAGNAGVIGNSLKIQPAAVKAADEAGTLSQLAPPFNQVNDAIKMSGAQNPVLQGGQDASAMAAPSAPSGGSAMPAPQAASAQAKTASARAKNLAPGSPTSGPKPGSGRLLNTILKRAV